MPSAPQQEPPRTNKEARPRREATRSKAQHDQTLRDQAWIGDAVLALYARLRILREDRALDGEKAVRMSSNRFLAAFGEPTAVEAAIGRVFERDGLDAAFAHIASEIMPVFVKQEEKRQQKAGKSTRRG